MRSSAIGARWPLRVVGEFRAMEPSFGGYSPITRRKLRQARSVYVATCQQLHARCEKDSPLLAHALAESYELYKCIKYVIIAIHEERSPNQADLCAQARKRMLQCTRACAEAMGYDPDEVEALW